MSDDGWDDPGWREAAEEYGKQRGGHGGNGHDQFGSEIIQLEIKRLAKLGLVEYERERAAAAKRLGMRASMLDRVVEAERKVSGDNGKQGHMLTFPEQEPWPEPVNGGELLSSIASTLRQYVVLSEQAADTVAMWSVSTYAVKTFMISPRLAIVSPTKQCGKTTLMDCLAELVWRPLKNSNCPAAALFRIIEKYQPTLLIDEAEHVVKSDNSDLLVILNSGHRQGECVPRCVGDDHEVRLFSTFAAVAFALIGRLPTTQADRSIHIKMRRRMANEPIERFRLDRPDHLRVLARKIARWTADNLESLRMADPDVGKLFNRVADNWRSLFAIADAVGGDWPRRAREAAAAISADTPDDEANIQLLADIQNYFAEHGLDRVFSADLVKALVVLEGRPWAEWGRVEKPMTQHALARQLKKFEAGDGAPIAPGTIRIGSETSKGYLRSQFDDVFRRYLPPQEEGIAGADILSKASHRDNADEMGASRSFQTVTPDPNVTVGNPENSNNDGHCDGVTVANGYGAAERLCDHCGGPSTAADPLCPWDWRARPDGIWLHSRCEGPWLDSEGQTIIRDSEESR
jgi:hypothetical protein